MRLGARLSARLASRRSAWSKFALNSVAFVMLALVQAGVGQASPGQIRAIEDRAVQGGAVEPDRTQLGACQERLLEIGIGEVRVDEPSAAKVQSREIQDGGGEHHAVRAGERGLDVVGETGWLRRKRGCRATRLGGPERQIGTEQVGHGRLVYGRVPRQALERVDASYSDHDLGVTELLDGF